MLLRGLRRFDTDVSELAIGLILRGQAFRCPGQLDLEDGTDRQSRNVGIKEAHAA
jgi:hypothetical protein